jgi:hypothetical protein
MCPVIGSKLTIEREGGKPVKPRLSSRAERGIFSTIIEDRLRRSLAPLGIDSQASC